MKMTLRSWTHEYGILVSVGAGFVLIPLPWLLPWPWKNLFLLPLLAYLVYSIYGLWLTFKYPERKDLPEFKEMVRKRALEQYQRGITSESAPDVSGGEK